MGKKDNAHYNKKDRKQHDKAKKSRPRPKSEITPPTPPPPPNTRLPHAGIPKGYEVYPPTRMERTRSFHQSSNRAGDNLSDSGSVDNFEEGPTYLLEHLATFTASHESGLAYPSDGMRRLLNREKTIGITKQEIIMKLERKWVLLLSKENTKVVERFPMELIREPTAFTREDPKELYNNIFIFVVVEDLQRKYDNTTEMHIFQCLKISAIDIVEDVKVYMSGKVLSGANVSKKSVLNENQQREITSASFRQRSISLQSTTSLGEEVSLMINDRHERNILLLNSCFDDIERFIARLHHTTAAMKELARRRKSRSKKKDIGDGLLAMRAKPPPEIEFVDIFQKFKLSFNLLARLKAHITDPNAPELVHFLFTPLRVIVDAAQDYYYDSPIPPRVLTPLLTQEAIDLLKNCLTSRESELWHSLGNTWLISVEDWEYPVSIYRPVFYSGWSPEILEPVILVQPIKEPMPQQKVEPPPEEPPQVPIEPPKPPYIPPAPVAPKPNAEEVWLNELKARGASIALVTHAYTSKHEKELSIEKGEYLEVLDDNRNWWKVRNFRGDEGHVAYNMVQSYNNGNKPSNVPPPPIMGRQVKQEFATIRDSSDEELPRTKSAPPRAPPPPPKQDTKPYGVTQMYNDPIGAMLINQEMEERLENYRKNRPYLEINKTPDVYISQKSSPNEVQEWLQKKGFNPRIQKQFQGVDGEKIFSLTKTQMMNYCGKSEGARLASQITIQKNYSGYRTARSSELKQVLANRKKMIDVPDSEPEVVQHKEPERRRAPSMAKSETNASIAPDNVSLHFKFLSGYEGKNGYDSSDEESDSDQEPPRKQVLHHTASDTKNKKEKPATLKDQIKRRHEMIVKSPNYEVVSNA